MPVLIALQPDRQVELGSVAGEVVGQLSAATLANRSSDSAIDPPPEGVGGRPIPVMGEVDARQVAVLGDEGQVAQRAVDD